jgi:hypothetical protein
MVTFYNLGELGRLGNQLFQYAAIKSLSLKNNYECKIPNITVKFWHGQKSLLNCFNIESRFFTDEEISKVNKIYNEPRWDKIDENFFSIPDNTNINGFFQSLFYFEEFENQIKKELTPKEEFLLPNKDYIKKLKEQYEGYEIVSVHIRRGDNMENNQEGLIKAYEKNGLYFTYFNKAKEVFKNKKVKFLIFTGGARGDENNNSDIKWCKENFIGDEFIFSENQKQIDDFCRIMSCDHNILSHASSFGWWAAYINPNPNKIVVAPEWYHPDDPTLKRNKFYPSNYILK